jgi:hypothetical protein
MNGYCEVTCGTCKLRQALDCMQSGGIEVTQDSAPLWNRLNTTKPLAVARPANTPQVATAVRCASASGIKIVPRSGGHSYIGGSVLSNAISIDLKKINSVSVSSDSTQVRVGAGARLGELFYKVSAATGGRRAVVGGVCPPVGLGGFLLGGGIGPLVRARGLACDQIIRLRMVLPNGSDVTASATHNTDLLWAACGGGGASFAVVTQFTMRTVPLPSQGYTTFMFRVPANRAAAFLERLVFFNSDGAASNGQGYDDRLGLKAVISPSNGQAGVEVQGSYLGPASEVRSKLRASGLGDGSQWGFSVDSINPVQEPWLDSVVRYAYMSTIRSPPDLLRVDSWINDNDYFKYKSAMLMPGALLPTAAYDYLLAWVGDSARENKPAVVTLDLLKGKIDDRSADATAFPYRSALGLLQYGASWKDGTKSTENLRHVSEAQTALESRFLTSADYAKYVNYVDLQQPSRRGYFGASLQRLRDLKARYDPGKLIINPLSY